MGDKTYECPECGRVTLSPRPCVGTVHEPHELRETAEVDERELREALDIGRGPDAHG